MEEKKSRERRSISRNKDSFRKENRRTDDRADFPRSRETVPEQREQDELPYLIIGRNAVREAVKSGRSIDRILVSKDPDGSLREILALARDRKIVIREENRAKLDALVDGLIRSTSLRAPDIDSIMNGVV